jgi:SpoVK/Ycf46/Vps4 family AAA+-type ATPase
MKAERLKAMFDARHSCVRIVTHEETEVLQLALETAHLMRLEAVTWSATEGVRRQTLEGSSPEPETTNPAQGMRWLVNQLRTPTLVIVLDIADQLQDTVNLRAFRDLVERVRDGSVGAGMVPGPGGSEGTMKRSAVLMIDHADRVPAVIGASSARYEITAPGDEEIRDLVKATLRSMNRARALKKEFEDEDAFGEALVANLRGLTRRQIRQLVAEIAADGRLTECDLERVQRGKRALLENAGVLEFIEAPTSLDDIGGLSRLKAWLNARAKSFEKDAAAFGLSPPRGVLLLGVQGAGKSLAAKAIATAWNRPLMRLDAGSLFNKYIGETERNLRDALAQAEAMSPVILWIDEIEKGFSSMGGGEDGGVSRRMFGTLLTWMQEHREPVFLVATANDIESLPPELMRKGRFDEIFFVDLPTEDVRRTIFEIHLRKRKKDPGSFNVGGLAKAADGFSGAEIEQAVLGGLHHAFSKGRGVTTEDIEAVVRGSPPLAVTRREAIEELRRWAKGRCVPAD